MDNSLNADIKHPHDKHIAITQHLPKYDLRKFFNHAPKYISCCIKRLVEASDIGCPRSKHIIQDCDTALEAMWTVCQSDEAIASGLADRNMKRYSIAGTGKHRGKRVKNTVEKDIGWIKAGALEAMREKQQITMG